MKLSEISVADVKGYSRIDDTDSDDLIVPILAASKHFVLSHTGLTADEADVHEDLSIACLCLCSDMYDNRCVSMQSLKSLNPTISTILNMYSKNLIG